MKHLLYIFFFLSSLLYSGEALYSDDIDTDDAKEMFEDGAIFIDVRTPSEFIHTGHALGHINIPVLYQEYTPKSIDIVENFAKMESEKKKGFNSRKLYITKINDNPDFFKNVMKVTGGDIEAEIVVVCHSGERSQYAANLLAKKGFENVYNLEGGFLAWKEAGLPWSVD